MGERTSDDYFFSAQTAPALAAWISRTAQPGKQKLLVDVGRGGGHLLAEMQRRGDQLAEVRAK